MVLGGRVSRPLYGDFISWLVQLLVTLVFFGSMFAAGHVLADTFWGRFMVYVAFAIPYAVVQTVLEQKRRRRADGPSLSS